MPHVLEPTSLLLTTLTACIIGFLCGLLGIGGGLVAIPALGIIFGMSEQAAQGTAIIMVASNLLVGVKNYHVNRKLDWQTGLVMGISSIPATILTASIATHVSSSFLRTGFAYLLIVLAFGTIYKSFFRSFASVKTKSKYDKLSIPYAIILGVVSGCLGGLFGVGGGLFTVVILGMFFAYPQIIAQGVCLISALPGAFINLYVYNRAGDVHWEIGAILALGGLVMVPLGSRLAFLSQEKILKACFAILAIGSAIGLISHH